MDLDHSIIPVCPIYSISLVNPRSLRARQQCIAFLFKPFSCFGLIYYCYPDCPHFLFKPFLFDMDSDPPITLLILVPSRDRSHKW